MGLDYVGRCRECGSTIKWMTEQSTPKEIGAFALEVAKSGLSLERMYTDVARKNLKPHIDGCPNKKQ